MPKIRRQNKIVHDVSKKRLKRNQIRYEKGRLWQKNGTERKKKEGIRKSKSGTVIGGITKY